MTIPSRQCLPDALAQLKAAQQYRELSVFPNSNEANQNQTISLIDLSSNDYLGIHKNTEYQSVFLKQIDRLYDAQLPLMGAASSRLLTGNHTSLQQLEGDLAAWYQRGCDSLDSTSKLLSALPAVATRTALVLNSGYHANIGILPALAALPLNTVILADKRIHASLIDGLKLSQNRQCIYKRYRHNDYTHLRQILTSLDTDIERVIIVTESIFSMDGDCADLSTLVAIKKTDSRVELYVDEAHAVGIVGQTGLGLAEYTQTLAEIDYLVGTFGKAFASVGAYVICDNETKQWLINQMRPLIFSTALPAINVEWTRFVLAKMTTPEFTALRHHLAVISKRVAHAVQQKQSPYHLPTHPPSLYADSTAACPPTYVSPIVPFIVGSNAKALSKAQQLKSVGFYALPIRPPTVPINSARIRLVINAALTIAECDRLIAAL